MPDKAWNVAVNISGNATHYSCEEVGLRGDRPFRLCTTHWGRAGRNVVPGDDPEAHPLSSRALEMYSAQGDPVRGVPVHSHDFYEFVLIRGVRNNLHITQHGQRPLLRGDVIVMSPGAVHGYQPMSGLFKTDVYLQPQWLSDELRLLWRENGLIRMLLATSLFELRVHEGLWQVHLEEPDTLACERELDTMVQEARSPQPSLALFNGCFLKMLSIVNKAFLHSDHYTGASLSREVWSVTAQIEAAIERGHDLDVESLADEVGMSRRHLDRTFRSSTGLSISEYYRNRRIQHAARMLMEPRQSVKEIAYQLNFADPAHFVRLFRSKMGMSPGAYRVRHLNAACVEERLS